MNGKPGDDGQGATGVLDVSAVRAFHDRLDTPVTVDEPPDPGPDDPAGTHGLLAELRALEELRNAISARQARLAVTVHARQQAADDARGIARKATGRVVGAHLGFARRCTPHRGREFLRVAHALVEDMPHTLAALTAGVIGEPDAARVVRETTGLTGAQRAQVDRWIRGELGVTSADRLAAAAKTGACQVAPEQVAARRKAAEADRRVRVRPAADHMGRLSALLPIKDALACQAALRAAADSAAAAQAGTRTGAGTVCRDRVMADTLVARVTGRARAQDPLGVCVNLLMGFDTLFGDTPAHVPGYGPVPADLVRDWVTAGDPTGPQLRRLFTHPGTGDIVGMDSRARTYPGLLARLILFRDHTCRTPWCSAPVRHTDHIQRHVAGGETSERNGQGLCEPCNYVKEHPDYHVTGHAAQTITRTGGFTLTSRPPAPPGHPPPTTSHPERTLMDLVFTHHLRRRDHEKRRRRS